MFGLKIWEFIVIAQRFLSIVINRSFVCCSLLLVLNRYFEEYNDYPGLLLRARCRRNVPAEKEAIAG